MPPSVDKGVCHLTAYPLRKCNPYHLLACHGNWYALAMNTAKARIGDLRPVAIQEDHGDGTGVHTAGRLQPLTVVPDLDP